MSRFNETVERVMRSVAVYGPFMMAVAAAMAVVAWLAWGGCDDAAGLAAVIVAGSAGGRHVVEGPLTTTLADEAAPGLLRSEVDERVTRIRPMSTPVDQISRSAGCRTAGSMKVEFYSVDTKPTEALVTEAVAGGTVSVDDVPVEFQLKVDNADIFEASETALLPEVKTPGGEALVVYVKEKRNRQTLNVYAVNLGAGSWDGCKAGMKVVRMGRAATELDVQTAQFEALPSKDYNNCQIFKAQIEESTYARISNKEVGWSFSDQEEVAIIDMRLGMEKSFLFGSRCRLFDPERHEEIMLTGGIWHQAGKDWSYSGDELTGRDVVSMMREAFTDNCGSMRKVLVAGSGLIERLNNLEYTKVINAGTRMTRWGIDFNELNSKFGSLCVVHSQVFDSCGHADDGLIVDPEYLTKYCHVPFGAERLDLKRSGVRNTRAVVITEASCLVLRYPKAHTRVTRVG